MESISLHTCRLAATGPGMKCWHTYYLIYILFSSISFFLNSTSILYSWVFISDKVLLPLPMMIKMTQFRCWNLETKQLGWLWLPFSSSPSLWLMSINFLKLPYSCYISSYLYLLFIRFQSICSPQAQIGKGVHPTHGRSFGPGRWPMVPANGWWQNGSGRKNSAQTVDIQEWEEAFGRTLGREGNWEKGYWIRERWVVQKN